MEPACFPQASPAQWAAAIYSAIRGSRLVTEEHDYISMTYYGDTNNTHVVTYRNGGPTGTIVATVTTTYVGGTPTEDDALIETVYKQ